MGFSWFSDLTSGKRVANLLHCSDRAQNYRIAVYLIEESVIHVSGVTAIGKLEAAGSNPAFDHTFTKF